MKKLLAVATVTVATVFTGAAFAQEPPAPTPAPAPAGGAAGTTTPEEGAGSESGFRFGARLGYMIGLGDSVEGRSLSDSTSGGVPIWLDIGYRITRNIYVGGYFNYAFLSLADSACPNGADCSASQLRFGVMGAYHILPTDKFDPWVGVGIGYEIVNTSVSVGSLSADGGVSGLEFLNLQVGGDYRATDNFRVGPFVSFSMGQYSSQNAGGNSADIQNTALHQWLTFGVRGAYDL